MTWEVGRQPEMVVGPVVSGIPGIADTETDMVAVVADTGMENVQRCPGEGQGRVGDDLVNSEKLQRLGETTADYQGEDDGLEIITV